VVDEDLLEYLTASPLRPLPKGLCFSRRQLQTRPTRIVSSKAIRAALPSVELDTVKFGFNQAFVRPEQIANIDRIGQVLELILGSNPNEIFVIEGHTDAVGSDADNEKLSVARAAAVKEMLTSYYDISPSSLTTVGLGESFLKIRTPGPERENRRIVIRRLTPLACVASKGP